MAALTDKALTDDLVDQILRDCPLPAVQSQFTHQQLLDIAWEQFTRRMAPILTRARPDLFRETHDITLEADTSTYTIPKYAMGRKLYLGHLLDSTGSIQKLIHREPTEDYLWNETSSNHPYVIRLQATQIEIKPAPSSGDIAAWPTLRTYIFRRPGRFVRATDFGDGTNTGRAAQVDSVASDTVTYTELMPSDFSASSTHDFYALDEPHRRVGTAIDATGAPSTSSQTFAVADAALISAGDWVCLENETVFMPFPVDFVGHLKDLVIHSIGKTQADQQAYDSTLKELAEDAKTLFPQAAEPMDGNPQIITLRQSPFLQALRRTRGLVRQ